MRLERLAYEHTGAWLDRMEGTGGFVNDLLPFLAHVTRRAT